MKHKNCTQCTEEIECYICKLFTECKEVKLKSKKQNEFWPFTSQKAKNLWDSQGHWRNLGDKTK